VADQGHQVKDLTPEDVSKGMADGRYLIVDVREPNEVAAEASIRVPSSFRFRVSIPWTFRIPGKQVVFACRSGEKIGHGVAGRSSRRFGLRQAPRGGNAGLEGRGDCRPETGG